MKRFAWALMLAVMVAGCATWKAELQRYSYEQAQMGVPFRIVIYAPDREHADRAAKAAFGRIEQLNAILSDYDADSELSRLSQTAGKGMAVPVSDDLWNLLQRSQNLARETDGAFDVTCGPLVSHWRKARREKKMPQPEDLADAARRSGHDKLRLDKSKQTAELLVRYMRLDLGAIAKGYAADEALRVLREQGISRALVSGGGDMRAGDPPPGACGWRVALAPHESPDAPPTHFASLRNNALATSGDIFQHVEIDGLRYSHIVDPHAGLGLTDHGLVVVIAQDCTTADSLSTAISVLGPERGFALARRQGACARFARQAAHGAELTQMPCFARYLQD